MKYILLSLLFFLPTSLFAADNVLSVGSNSSFPVAHFNGFLYQFHVENTNDELLSIYQSTDGKYWHTLTQKIGNGRKAISNAIVYQDALYVSIDYSGSSDLTQIWKTTDGIHFTNVIDESDSLYDESVRDLYNFFTINDKLCLIAQKHETGDSRPNLHLQTHCTDNGTDWAAQDVTGYLQNKGEQVRTINNILSFDGKVYALIQKNLPNRLILLSSTDGIDWHVVENEKKYFSYRSWNPIVHMLRFKNQLYLFMPSKHGSGIKIFNIQNDQLVPVQYNGLVSLRGLRTMTLGEHKDSVYIYGAKKIDGQTEHCLYHSTDLVNWKDGSCFIEKRKQLQRYNGTDLEYIGGNLYIDLHRVHFTRE